MKISSCIAIALTLCTSSIAPARATVVLIGCADDGAADSCSAAEVHDGGTVLVDLVTFQADPSGPFISSGHTDGPAPDYSQVLITGDDSLPEEPALVINDNSEHQVNSTTGSTFSFITYEFRLGLGGDLDLHGMYLEIDPNIFMTENTQLRAVLTVEGQQNEVIVPGPPQGGSGAEPVSNVVYFSPIPPDQDGFVYGVLFLEASEITPASLSLAAFSTVSIRWRVGDLVFGDSFESGDTSRWSQTLQ